MNRRQLKNKVIEEQPKAMYNGKSEGKYPISEYEAWLEDGTRVVFRIPSAEMKFKKYDEIEDAVDLIKWLV